MGCQIDKLVEILKTKKNDGLKEILDLHKQYKEAMNSKEPIDEDNNTLGSSDWFHNQYEEKIKESIIGKKFQMVDYNGNFTKGYKKVENFKFIKREDLYTKDIKITFTNGETMLLVRGGTLYNPTYATVDGETLYGFDKVLTDAMTALGSTVDPLGQDFKQIEDEVHKDIGKMKELLVYLNEVGGAKSSKADMDHYRKLLDNINPDFLDNVNTMLNEDGDINGGVITADSIKISISKADRKSSTEQTAAESYMHEVIHAFTRTARRLGTTETDKIVNQIRFVFKQRKN
jgi:hypothetical protein